MRLLKITIILSIFIITSCGFRPIYNPTNVEEDSYKEELAAITVQQERKRINQQLKNNLEDALNPGNIKVPPKYLLTTSLSERIASTFITISGTSGRQKVVLEARYKLTDIESGEVISVGETEADDDYNVSDSRFANYTITEEIALNLTKIVAQNIRNLIANDLHRQKGERFDMDEQHEIDSEIDMNSISPYDNHFQY